MIRKKTLFNASFEESLNLEDDSIAGQFIIANFKSAQEKEQYRGTLLSQIWLTILTIIFIIGPNWLIMRVTDVLIPYVKDYFQLSTVRNFLPEWIFWCGTFLWLGLILSLKVFRQNFILIYRGQFHLYVTFMFWMIVELNLLLLTIFNGVMGVQGVLLFYGIFCILSYIIITNRKKTLYFSLYGVNHGISKLDKLFSTILKTFFNYIWLVIAILLGIRFVFPSILAYFSNVTGMLAIWMIGNLLFVALEMNYLFPFFLQGYYKLKYSEEYREWEGKSPEEWYGKNYLKTHKELLRND